MARGRGRPKKEINWLRLIELARYGLATDTELMHVAGVSRGTFYAFLRQGNHKAELEHARRPDIGLATAMGLMTMLGMQGGQQRVQQFIAQAAVPRRGEQHDEAIS